MLAEVGEDVSIEIGLRQQAAYWQALHGRAVQRETALREETRKLRTILEEKDGLLSQLRGQVEALKAKVVWLQR